MVRKLKLSPDNDNDWCREEIYRLVQGRGGAGVWEDHIYHRMCKRVEWDHQSWLDRSSLGRSRLVQEALSYLLRAARIEPIPEKTQATGRRCFKAINVLDSIVAAIEASE
jgi:hypothetical protein